MRFSKAISILV